METFKVLFRSFFKRGRNNLIKIISLSVGLALGLVLIAKVYFEQSYNDFFPDKERIYMILSNYSTSDGAKSYEQASGAVAVGMKAELPEVEVSTRYTWLASKAVLVTPDKNKYSGDVVMADSCLFDIFPRPILAGDVKDVLSRPMYVMISDEIAEKMGGASSVIGQTFEAEEMPGKVFTIGGVFKALPKNTHLKYDIVVSMASVGHIMWAGSSTNWVGNDRYLSYVKLYPNVKPEDLSVGIEQMCRKYLPIQELEKAGVGIGYSFKPLAEIHVGDDNTKRMMLIMSLLAVTLLFVAVMNYVLIVISSLVNRSKEMAVNKCYGASEKNIYFKMLSETGVDLFISLIIASLLVLCLRGIILSLLGTTLSELFTIKSTLLLFVVCVIIFIVAAVIPGYLYARIPVAVAFRKFNESKRYWKLGLLFIQFIAAGFFVTLLVIVGRQYHFMVNDNPGYVYDNLAYCSLAGVDSELRQKALDEISRMSEVSEVTTCSQLFFGFASGNNIWLPNDDRELFNIADLYSVGNGYLDLMEISLVEGRSFIENTPSSKEVMVSRNFIEKIGKFTDWPDGVVGKSIVISEHSQGPADLYTICGVYEDIRLGIIGAQDTRSSVMFYNDKPSRYLMVKFHQLTPDAMKKVTGILQKVLPDKEIVVNSYSTEMIDRYRDSANFRDSILAAGLVTLIICLIGLIGYTNDETNRRKKETAIRKVNGATILDIQRLFLKDVNYMALPAITIGCIIAYFVANSWLKKFADKVDLTIFLFIGCALVVLFIILSAVSIKSYRAANENPADAVKSE
ncbi:MAG: multidrug ABC transporter substrate-binding protein [Tannerella sp.]|jgi:putative ABC transport system permease protein|nr:multidrug ABC transporter substrate-binding protein [Tannerella sp.]